MYFSPLMFKINKHLKSSFEIKIRHNSLFAFVITAKASGWENI